MSQQAYLNASSWESSRQLRFNVYEGLRTGITRRVSTRDGPFMEIKSHAVTNQHGHRNLMRRAFVWLGVVNHRTELNTEVTRDLPAEDAFASSIDVWA